MRFPKLKTKTWIIAGVAVVLGIYLIPALSSFFGGFATAIKQVFGGINTGVKKLLVNTGLDSQSDQTLTAIVTGGTENPWNPNFYVPYFENRQTAIYTSAAADDIIEKIKSAQNIWMGVNMDKYRAVFNMFPSKCHFSSLNYFWAKSEGTQLAGWMDSGWLGFFCLSNQDMLELNSIINGLPVTAGG